ncbi:MAG: HD domain-containing protein [Methylotenera sp.]|nr:HD domain-containing protein [Oligoflexia bacterium]
MANIIDTDFIAISQAVFDKIQGALDFDVYIKRAADAYTRLFTKGDTPDPEILQRYKSTKGVEFLYVRKEDYREYLLLVETLANRIFGTRDPNDKIPVDEMLDVLKETANLAVFEIIERTEVDQKSLHHATQTIAGCLNILAKDPKSFAKIFRIMGTRPYAMRHALTTSIFSLILGKIEQMESNRNLLILGLGSLFHDIGMSMIPFDVESKYESLTPDEWKTVKEHTHLGKRMLENVKGVPTEVRLIIMQHHEQPNGSGYPNGLRGPQIYYPAKIVAIADVFSALTCQRPFRKEPFSPAKALELMREDTGKFDHVLLDGFSKMFTKTE